MTTIEDDGFEALKRAAISSGDKIEKSTIFLNLLSLDYKTDPLCALQLGIAIMLDKPIGIIAIEGATIPENLKRIAFHTESLQGTYDSKTMEEATKRIAEAARKYDNTKSNR